MVWPKRLSLEDYKMPLTFPKASPRRDSILRRNATSRKKIEIAPLFVRETHDGEQEKRNAIPPLSKNASVHHSSCSHKLLFDDSYAQAKYCLSSMEDPLWKFICTELLPTMGPSIVLAAGNCTVGNLSKRDETVNITCQTETSAQFLQQHDFVILERLRRYFPALKGLRVTINP